MAQAASGRVVWYGIYTVSESQGDQGSDLADRQPFCQHAGATEDQHRRQFRAKHFRFGMSYVLSGKAGNQVTVKHVYRFPPPGMPDAATGGPRTTYEFVRKAAWAKPS